jgi:hypothetical protein
VCGGFAGGGGVGDSSGDSSDVPPSKDEIYTDANIESTRQGINEAARSVLTQAGKEKIDLEDFVGLYITALENRADVKSAILNEEESIFDTYIDVEFVSGFHCKVNFFSEEYYHYLYNDPSEDSSNFSISSSIRKYAQNTKAPLLKGFAGRSFIKLLDDVFAREAK